MTKKTASEKSRPSRSSSLTKKTLGFTALAGAGAVAARFIKKTRDATLPAAKAPAQHEAPLLVPPPLLQPLTR